jgi:hypothetical protein
MDLFVNLEEKIGKIVGKRRMPKDSFAYAMQLQEAGVELAKSLGWPRIPRGVYKFRTHEEADEWLMMHLTRKGTS